MQIPNMDSSDDGNAKTADAAVDDAAADTSSSSASASAAADTSLSSPSSSAAASPSPRTMRRTSSTSTTTAPEPPRWRFVKEAKKSLGYSSLHAGSYIRGHSSDDLGVKYVAPDISMYQPKKKSLGDDVIARKVSNPENKESLDDKDDIEVGKLGNIDYQNGTMDDFNSPTTVGKLQFDEHQDIEHSYSGSFAGLPKNNPSNESQRAPYKEYVNYLHLSPKQEREGAWFDGEAVDQYIMPGDETNPEELRSVGKIGFHEPGEVEDVFIGEFPRGSKNSFEEHGDREYGDIAHVQQEGLAEQGHEFHNGDGGELGEEEELGQGSYDEFLSCLGLQAPEGHNNHPQGDEEDALSVHHGDEEDIFKDTEAESEITDDEEEKKRKCYYLLIPLLFILLATVVGVSVGTKKESGSTNEGGGVLIPTGVRVPIVFVYNETTAIPSLQPSMNSDQPSMEPSNGPSTQPSPEPSFVPSTNPTYLPSLMPSTNPTSLPSLMPSSSPPTQSPLLFFGACPEQFSASLFSYSTGAQVAANNVIYECKIDSCGAAWFGMGSLTATLQRQGWDVVGSCLGTLNPTRSPTTSPSRSPSQSPTRSPTQRPSFSPTPDPTGQPTRKPTQSPSFSPTPIPSNAPTPDPTGNPTVQPTDQPTSGPTCSEPEFNLCFAIDMSGSVCLGNRKLQSDLFNLRAGCKNFDKITEFSTDMVTKLDDDLDVEKSFSVVQFSSSAKLVGTLSSAEETIPVIEQLDYSAGSTHTAGAIERCQSSFAASTLNRKNFIVLITDGVPTVPVGNPEKEAEAEASTAKADGTTIIPIFISEKDNSKEAIKLMERLSSDGEVFDVSDFDSLSSLQDTLVNEVACG